MCNHYLPGTNHPVAQSSRNARRLAKRARKTKGRNERMGGGMPTQRTAAAATTTQQPPRTISFPQESELEDVCPHCHTEGCDPDFCPEKPSTCRCGAPMVELQEYEVAFLPPGEGQKVKRTFTALDEKEAEKLRARLEELQASGQIAGYRMNAYRTWMSRQTEEWLDGWIAQAKEEAAEKLKAAPAGTVH